MKPFTLGKVIRRTVKIKASDRALPDTEWVLSFDSQGVRVRRLGESKHSQSYLSWRSVIGHSLIHRNLR
jgi:hypothetical protein